MTSVPNLETPASKKYRPSNQFLLNDSVVNENYFKYYMLSNIEKSVSKANVKK